MANPNIVNVSDIRGKVTGLALTTVNNAIVLNSSGSNKVFKINTITVANIDGTSAADLTGFLYQNQANTFYLAYTISIPADASLVLISKDTSIYLQENDSIVLTASANGDLQAVCSYEEIS